MDPNILEEALEAFGNDLETAIRNLNKLRLESSVADLSSNDHKFENGTSCTEGNKAFIGNGNMESTSDQPSNGSNISSHTSEWVELFVREMMRGLVHLELLRFLRSQSWKVQVWMTWKIYIHKENIMLKEQLENMLRENSILKRAVAIQYDQLKEFVNTSKELGQLKQLVAHYQEQVRTLEINNYALIMHLRQAQQNNSIPGRFNADVF